MKKDLRNYGKLHPRFAEGGAVNDPYGLMKNPVHEGEFDRSTGIMRGAELLQEPYRGGGDWPTEAERNKVLRRDKMAISPQTYELKRENVYQRGGSVHKRK